MIIEESRKIQIEAIKVSIATLLKKQMQIHNELM